MQKEDIKEKIRGGKIMSEVKWIKIVTDVFDNRKIKQIEKLPEADAIIIIWFKLLCLAGELNENGLIMITKDVPYTDEMLANAFNKPINIIRLALEVFQKFNMIEIVNNMYCVSNWEKYQNIEGLDKIREQTRKRVAKHREKQKILTLDNCNVTSNATVTQSNATEEDIDKDKEEGKKKSKRKTFTPPTLREIEDYIKEKQLNVDANKFFTYFEAGNWIDSKGNKVKNWKQKLITWDNHNYGNNNAKSKNDENKQEEQVNYEHELTYSEKDFTEEQYARLRRGQMPREELIEILEKKNV